MTSKKDILLLYFLILLEFLLLFNSKIIIKNVLESTNLFIINIFPSLFPTMVIGLLLIKNDFYKIIPKFIKMFFSKAFNFNDITTSIFLSSMICGTPSSSLFINDYMQKGLITEKEAENLLCCTHFINPLFVINIVGNTIFNSSKVGLFMLLLLYLSNFLKAFSLRKNFNKNINSNIKKSNNDFVSTLTSSIKESVSSLLCILGIVIFFNILICLITNIFNLNLFSKTIINILVEMTSGVIGISYLNISCIIKFILSYFSLSFGGLCIIMQTISMIQNKKIKYLKYFIFRLF